MKDSALVVINEHALSRGGRRAVALAGRWPSGLAGHALPQHPALSEAASEQDNGSKIWPSFLEPILLH